MTELPWIQYARSLIGIKEYPGPKHNPSILGWLKRLGSIWMDDETPWCGTFVGEVMKHSGRKVVKDWFRALAWTAGGVVLERPAYGCIVVFTRQGGGHVGFVVGVDASGRLMVLGGNQGNQVNIRPFERSRVKAYVWPANADGTILYPAAGRYNLPILNANGAPSSRNEA